MYKFAIKLILYLIISTVVSFAQSATRTEILTNTSIIELSKLGLSEAVISEKILQSECNFDTSINGFRQLKDAKVSDAIIALMLNPRANTSVLETTKAPATSPALKTSGIVDSEGHTVPLPPDKGAYLWDGKKLQLLIQNHAPSMGMNVGRAIGSAIIPFMKNQIELQLIGTSAAASFDYSQPIIIVSGLGDVIPGMPSYRLLSVKQGGVRKDRRILGTYDISALHTMSMVDNEIPCEIKKVSEGIYTIKPAKPLTNGEYGLVETQVNQTSMAGPLVWDFGIYAKGRSK